MGKEKSFIYNYSIPAMVPFTMQNLSLSLHDQFVWSFCNPKYLDDTANMISWECSFPPYQYLNECSFSPYSTTLNNHSMQLPCLVDTDCHHSELG
ncbi:hypothetical protein SLE2022_167140 [Rubroshorea leprosula]